MKTIFDLQTRVVTLLCTAALAGLTACEADPVMQESGKLPDKGSIEEVHVMLCSSNSVENRVDVLLTEGGVMTKNFYLRQTQPAAAGYSLDAWCDASLLNDYDAGDEIERTLLPEANYEFPDGKTLDLSAATQRSELKRIKFSATGLAAGEYVLPLTVAEQDAPDENKTLYYNVSVRQPYTDEYALHDGHDLFFVFYINTNDFQPLLVLDYIMQKKLARGSTVAWHEAIGNIVNLRTVQVGYDAATSRALLNLGSDMTYVLSQSTKYIRPLQEHGRKVCISIEGGGTGLGFCNLTDTQIEDFAAQVKTVIEQYGLDGVNLWDRNSGYGKEGMPAVNTTSYPKLIADADRLRGADRYFLEYGSDGRHRRRRLYRLCMVGLQQRERSPAAARPVASRTGICFGLYAKADCQPAQGAVRLRQLSHLSCCPNGRRGYDAGAGLSYRLDFGRL